MSTTRKQSCSYTASRLWVGLLRHLLALRKLPTLLICANYVMHGSPGRANGFDSPKQNSTPMQYRWMKGRRMVKLLGSQGKSDQMLVSCAESANVTTRRIPDHRPRDSRGLPRVLQRKTCRK